MAGNFGEVFKFGELVSLRKIAKFKTAKYCDIIALRIMWLASVVAKFKTRQYVVKMDLPNLMLAKFPTITESVVLRK